jgi:hypothetical protein
MDRARLSILAVCALLTTTLNPFGDAAVSGNAAAEVQTAALPAVSAAPQIDSDEADSAATATEVDHSQI